MTVSRVWFAARQVAWLTVEEAQCEMPEARAVRVTDAVSLGYSVVRVHDGTHLLSSA